MNESLLRKARWPWPGRCVVCGTWGWLKVWDEGLQGRFCVGCFDHVVDAEAALASQGLVSLARADALRRRRANGGVWHLWMELGALWVLWGSGVPWPPGVAWPPGKGNEGPLSAERGNE